MSNKPSRGALDFARRHGLPEPRTKDEAVKMMRKKIGLPRYGEHYTGSTTNAEKAGYDLGDDNSGDNK